MTAGHTSKNVIEESQVSELLAKVVSKSKYSHIHDGLIESLIRDELGKRASEKEVFKAVTGKLHQVGAAYFQRPPAYEWWLEKLADCPGDVHSVEARGLCAEQMGAHSSTRERLPIMTDFFNTILAGIAPVKSILDLACGFNPLALAWMPVSAEIQYFGCDIFADMTDYLNKFYHHMNLAGEFCTCDLTAMQFTQRAQIAFLLKTLPCLEQIEKDISAELLERIPADYLLISYPVRSLGGRSKGMGKTYENQFNNLAARMKWDFERFEFASELAFLVKK
jgi:16S rRNA (guanine(1405)-N(7))-methyltransferase